VKVLSSEFPQFTEGHHFLLVPDRRIVYNCTVGNSPVVALKG
jgi:hypothetical protein